MKVRCNACRGTYDTEQRDGSRYFHSCPPLGVREARELLDRKQLELTDEQRATIDQAAALDLADPRPPGAISRVDLALGELMIARPGARNENVHGDRGRGRPSDPIAPGAGVTTVDAGAAAPRARS